MLHIAGSNSESVLKKKCGWNIWLGIVIAVVGLYLLCMSGSLSFQSSDLMVLVCALLLQYIYL